jgi:large subunit ribosomal protein L13
MTKRMKTYSLKGADIDKRWQVVDAAGQTLGRLATQVAGLLMGKHRPTYSAHLDMGDFVVVINAAKVAVTGNKVEDKKYYRHTGYMGGLKTTTFGTMVERHPERVIELAVRGMLPRNRLNRQRLRHLKVYAGPDHPHEAQVNASRKRDAQDAGKQSAAAAASTEKSS